VILELTPCQASHEVKESNGKPAGVRCIQLTADNRCAIFGDPRRPQVCARLQPEPAMCGSDRGHALRWLAALENATRAA
jgi:uncharacterized protein